MERFLNCQTVELNIGCQSVKLLSKEVIKDGRKGGNQRQVHRFYGGGDM